MIHTFLLALHNLNDIAAAEIYSRDLQLALRSSGPHCCFHSSDLSCGLSGLQKGSSPRRPSLECMLSAGALPSHSLLLPLMSNIQCEVVHCHAEQGKFFSSGTFTCHRFFKHLNVISHMGDFPFGRKSTNMQSPASQMTDPVTFQHCQKRVQLYDTIPCSVISFLGQNGETSFHHQSQC